MQHLEPCYVQHLVQHLEPCYVQYFVQHLVHHLGLCYVQHLVHDLEPVFGMVQAACLARREMRRWVAEPMIV